LQDPCPFIKVEFHAWKYQDNPATWAYLYECLSKEYYNEPAGYKIKERYQYYKRIVSLNYTRKGFLPIIKLFLIALIGATAVFITNYILNKDLEKINFAFKLFGISSVVMVSLYSALIYLKKEYSTKAKDLFLKYSQKHSFKEQLGIQAEVQEEILFLLKKWIPEKDVKKKRILLFIDDIDRCNEIKIIQIIDSLRIMLDELEIAKRIVVLAAIDERILKIAISNKYFDLVIKDFEKDNDKKNQLDTLAREYMDKLFIGGIKLRSLNSFERKEILESIAKGKVSNIIKPDIIHPNKIDNYDQNRDLEIITSDEEVWLQKYLPNYENSRNEDNDQFELESFELNFLNGVLELSSNITPRTIRIFYYRYLMAKRFMSYKFSKNKFLLARWNNPRNDKSILPFLIMQYSTTHSPLEIAKEYEVIRKSDREVNASVLGKSFTINSELLREIYMVIELVVPY